MNADALVRPIIESKCFSQLLGGDGDIKISVRADAPPSKKEYLRRIMAREGRGDFNDEIRPMLEEGIEFHLSDGKGKKRRWSSWIIVPDGRMIIMSFSGQGVLDWVPNELGFVGDPKKLHVRYYNVGVIVTPDGEIARVVERRYEEGD